MKTFSPKVSNSIIFQIGSVAPKSPNPLNPNHSKTKPSNTTLASSLVFTIFFQ
ncbi:hypothetical protein AB3S75_040042 [Citrus x aurantiifolia]